MEEDALQEIAGNTVADARKAVLIGGAVPLIMVLSWNLIVLGLSGSGTNAAAPGDPISLLLSVNPSALQAFAFSALATSLIGYAVSFPKQLLDTVELIAKINLKNNKVGVASSQGNGRASFTTGSGSGRCIDASDSKPGWSINMIVMPLVLGVPVLIASFFPSTFSRALDFAGLYANCFLFGILPPAMAYIHQSRKKSSTRLTVPRD
ncbi:hypothetical protein C1H46_042474 [Malus baccata]|uniref:Amino acid transporter transmembrane domain-containing protein n=1 Tax=Malus baccata TaxID=106549 RepID=A0A540KCM4_MALBA|nr:hypothetical protein C1H46_042474 [Malus baccata]